jgi:hypothetical protein
MMPGPQGAVVPAPWSPWLPYKLPQPRVSQPSRLLPGWHLLVSCSAFAEFESSNNSSWSQLLLHQGTVSKHFNRGGETSPSTLALPLGSTHYPPICNNAIVGFYLLPARRPWCVLTFWFYLLPPPLFFF